MLKTFLPKAFRSEKTPSNKGYFNLERWIQERIQDGTIDLGTAGVGATIYTADDTLSEYRTITLDSTGIQFGIDNDNFFIIEDDSGVKVRYLVNGDTNLSITPTAFTAGHLDSSVITLGNVNGGEDNMTTRAYILVEGEELYLGVYNGNDIDVYFSVSNAGSIEISNETTTTPQSITLTSSGTIVMTSSGVQFPALNTTQRDALSPNNGTVIYNTTTTRFEFYQDDDWVYYTATSATA